MHTLIVGAPGAGKSTLIERLLAETDRPVFGYRTKKETALMDLEKDPRGAPIFIYPAGEETVQTAENRIGFCVDRRPTVFPETFDRYAPKLARTPPQNAIILMDEIGFMETRSKAFCDAILQHLDGDIPVLAAVKDKDIPFLNAVRGHPNCRCFFLTPETRAAQSEVARTFFLAQLK